MIPLYYIEYVHYGSGIPCTEMLQAKQQQTMQVVLVGGDDFNTPTHL